jgi:hypothetical protein
LLQWTLRARYTASHKEYLASLKEGDDLGRREMELSC